MMQFMYNKKVEVKNKLSMSEKELSQHEEITNSITCAIAC